MAIENVLEFPGQSAQTRIGWLGRIVQVVNVPPVFPGNDFKTVEGADELIHQGLDEFRGLPLCRTEEAAGAGR